MLANERRQANMPAVTTRPKQEQTPRIWCGLVHKRFAESCALKAGNQRQTRQKICTCSEADERKPMHYKLYFDLAFCDTFLFGHYYLIFFLHFPAFVTYSLSRSLSVLLCAFVKFIFFSRNATTWCWCVCSHSARSAGVCVTPHI